MFCVHTKKRKKTMRTEARCCMLGTAAARCGSGAALLLPAAVLACPPLPLPPPSPRFSVLYITHRFIGFSCIQDPSKRALMLLQHGGALLAPRG